MSWCVEHSRYPESSTEGIIAVSIDIVVKYPQKLRLESIWCIASSTRRIP